MNITPEVMILKNDDAKFETVVAIKFGNKLIQQSFISDTVDGMVKHLEDLVPDIAEHRRKSTIGVDEPSEPVIICT